MMTALYWVGGIWVLFMGIAGLAMARISGQAAEREREMDFDEKHGEE